MWTYLNTPVRVDRVEEVGRFGATVTILARHIFLQINTCCTHNATQLTQLHQQYNINYVGVEMIVVRQQCRKKGTVRHSPVSEIVLPTDS
jgi:hypothetical protein